MRRFPLQCARRLLFVGSIAVLLLSSVTPARAQTSNYEFNDSHFHLTNNIQEGPDIHDFLNMMGTKAGRVALFGLPLPQQWSYRVDDDRAPMYYLHSRRSTVLLLVHGRLDRHGLQVLAEATAGSF